jgi:hypothetical protein
MSADVNALQLPQPYLRFHADCDTRKLNTRAVESG